MAGSGYYSVLDDERIVADFYTRLGVDFAGSWASRVGLVIPSDSETENYNWIGAVPQMRQWNGARLAKQLGKFSMTLTNVEYEATIQVRKADLRRDKTGQLRVRFADLARRAATHWESLVDTLISNNGTAYDSQNYFDTDHNESGSNQVNALTASHVTALDVTTATAPTADEMAKAITGVIGYMLGYKDDQGEPTNGDARSWMVMCGTANIWAAAQHAVMGQNLSSGASNPLAGVREAGMNIEVVLNPRRSANTTLFWVFRTDGILKPFILQDETPINLEEEDPGMTSKELIVGVDATRAAGYGMWNMAAKATLS